MSSPDEYKPKTDGKRERRRPDEPVPAGRKALEQALFESGKAIEDLIGPSGPA
ncbi:hypothetical protein ACGFJC_19130 [Nonomuraea fuscirosea]|jgi:hypothetical protein|uniref:hypothetical protein n=1 Tax=Nonomuraea fuscirosea TaxID=1291556 RepID=UPI002DD8E2A9|nr:hypothetical protein [Nonomuraea fuscirosea]WSA51501.1 hypothetical protein OIE67_46910 [Nonomuraea fuscirosea]